MLLAWWAPEFLSPSAPQPSGPLLAEQLAAFRRANNGKIEVEVVRKARYGKGGLLDYLQSAMPVAPGILPDLIVLDVSELEAAATTGLLQPLDRLLDERVLSSLYPFAVSAGQFGDHFLAVQFAADFDHLIFRRSVIPIPPGTWDELLAAPVTYLLPLDSQHAGTSSQPAHGLPDALFSQYLSAGTPYNLAIRKLTLEAEPLQRVFTFYQAAIRDGVIPQNLLLASDAETVWNSYSQDKAPLANVSARRYLAEGSMLKDTGFATAPGFSGPLKPVATGWALAITATDPARQRAAATLIAWLLKPEQQGAWTAAAGWLPTSPAAFKQWGNTDYVQFLEAQLTEAVSLPVGPDSALAATAIKQGWESVIKGEGSPQSAVEAIMNPHK